MAATAALLVGCYDYGEYDVVSGEPVRVELAYSFSSTTGEQTRQQDDAINNQTNLRLPSTSNIRLIPLDEDAPKLTDISLMYHGEKDGNPKLGLFRSSYCDLATGVNGFLVYGKPESTADNKMYYGSLKESFPVSISSADDILNGISFSLEPIYNTSTNGVPAEATELADYMTGIANITVNSKKWSDATDENLQNLYKKFTNFGKSLPGSAANVKKWVSEISKSARNFTCQDEAEESIRTQIRDLSDPSWDESTASYPRNRNLPDGASVLRWAEVEEEVEGNTVKVKKFVPQLYTTTMDNINSMERFAYPAPLYYFIDSDIRATNKEVDFETVYNGVTTDATKTAWDKVLESDDFKNADRIVTLNTKSVVVTNPVQYAVAQLRVKIKAASANLLDAKSPEPNSIPVTENQFPLKGIIVCDQRPVDYKFEQKNINQGSTSDAEVLFIYDNGVQENCYLRNTNTWVDGCNTLVLQSQAGEDVNIMLEFENKSGVDFTCVDGIVYNGTRFYLIGKVVLSTYSSDGKADKYNKGQVFTKDYITTVNMTVSSLAKAYNVPPNLLSNNLEIGVETTPEWIAATPTTIRLE